MAISEIRRFWNSLRSNPLGGPARRSAFAARQAAGCGFGDPARSRYHCASADADIVNRDPDMTRHYRIASIPADGIGPEVISAGLEVLDAVAARDGGFSLTIDHY